MENESNIQPVDLEQLKAGITEEQRTEIINQRTLKWIEEGIESCSSTLQPYIANAKMFREAVAESKTTTKKQYYKKKLKKNNTVVLELLLRMEQLNNMKDTFIQGLEAEKSE